MKHMAFFLLMSSLLFSNEHKLLISGFTKHEKSHRDSGKRYNEFNYGGGYEYTSFKEYNELYFVGNITALKDSFDEWQYTLSSSPNIRFKLSQNTALSVGVAVFGMFKKDNYKSGVSESEAEYDFVMGAAPVSSLYYKDFSVNFAYVPTFSYNSIDTVGFLIIYFGWTF